MTPQLHPIAGKNRFCGPTALASVLGISTDHAARLIREFSGDKRVTGVYDVHLSKALAAAGCKAEYHYGVGEGCAMLTASEWVQAHRALFASKHVIINFGRHYGTLLGAHYQCSLTRAKVSLQEIPQAHKKVECFFAIHGLPDEAPRDDVALERKHNARAFSKAQALDSVNTENVQLRTDDGATYIEIQPGGKVRIDSKDIELHARNSYSWDVDGYGQRISSQGGGSLYLV